MIKKILGKNKLLILILLLAFSLRIIGLYPNFLQHPNEPGVIEPSNKIAINTIFHLNPDPNVEPAPFKYASAIFYMHAFIQAIILGSTYVFYKFTGYTFALSKTAFGQPSFEEFLVNIGPTALSDTLLWFHRLPSVIFGVATVFLVYKTALLLLKNRNIALLSATALAVMPHHVRDSHYATIDIIQTFFFLLAFLLSIKVWQRANIKNCALTGLVTGFATSLKYFPLPFLPMVFFYFMARKKIKPSYVAITILTLMLGYWIGMPYIFSHFQEIINWYKQGVAFYAPNQRVTDQSLAQRFLPSYLHGYHLLFFFKTGIGPISTIMAMFGIISGLKRWKVATFSLLIIPTVNLLFITFYLEAIYETLTIPMLPFFAIFTGIGVWWAMHYFNQKIFLILGLLFIVFLPPLFNSAEASFACTKTITEFEAHDWIADNIPEGAKLAFQPNMRLPSKNFDFIRSEPKEKFLLSEIQEAGAEYMALHSGYTDRYAQWLDDNILLPKYIKDNEFTHLALQEFEKNTKLLKSFVRPKMCENSRIYIYKVPPIIAPAKNVVVGFNFNNSDSLLEWELGKKGVPSGAKSEIIPVNGNVLKYQYDPESFLNQIPFGKMALPPSFYGTPLRSPFIEISEARKYSAQLKARRIGNSERQIPDGFLRLDYYEKKNEDPILTRLSKRLKLDSYDWQNLVITAYSPNNAHFATISFQTLVATQKSEYLIKEAFLLRD